MTTLPPSISKICAEAYADRLCGDEYETLFQLAQRIAAEAAWLQREADWKLQDEYGYEDRVVAPLVVRPPEDGK